MFLRRVSPKATMQHRRTFHSCILGRSGDWPLQGESSTMKLELLHNLA